jgi:hypothetical protein
MAGTLAPTLPNSAQGVPTGVYGVDWSCTNDVDGGGLEVDGVTVLAQALYRRIITPRGGLIYDLNYGFDIRQFLNADVAQGDIARIAFGVDTEFRKDQRVFQSQSTVTFTNTVLTLYSFVTPLSQSSFSLVVVATSVTVQLLQAG